MHDYIVSSKKKLLFHNLALRCIWFIIIIETNKINSWVLWFVNFLYGVIATVRCLFFHTQFLLRLLVHYTLIFCRLFLKGDILSITWYDLCSLIHKYWLSLKTTFIILVLRDEKLPDEKQKAIHLSEGSLFILWRINLHLCLRRHYVIDV